MKTLDRLTIILVGLLICGTYMWSVTHHPAPKDAETIAVNGIGKIKIAPDTLTLRLAITETWSTTKEAQHQMSEKLIALKALLSGYNLSPEKIKTESLNVAPEYDWKDGERRLLGQQATQNLILELSGEGFNEKGGKIISMLPKVGNVLVNSSDFTISDPSAGTDKAREKAFEDAKAKAEQLAKLSGKRLGKILSITDGVSSNNDYPIYGRGMMKAQSLMAESEMQENADLLSAGENEKTHSVDVVFELK